jgi:hypothetical protein
MHSDSGLSEHELSLEMATALPDRNTLGIAVTTSPDITVTPVVGVAIATQVLTKDASNVAWLTQYTTG